MDASPPAITANNVPTPIKPTFCTRITQCTAVGANSVLAALIVYVMIVNNQVLGPSSNGDYQVWIFVILFGGWLGLTLLAIYGALRFTSAMIIPNVAVCILGFIAIYYYYEPTAVLLLILSACSNAVLVWLISKGSHEAYVGQGMM